MSITSTGLSAYEKKQQGSGMGEPRGPPSDASQTIGEFCASERISRSMYYKLRRLGLGPREMVICTARRISPEARADWRRAREQDGQRS
jgi:hypothetical protein